MHMCATSAVKKGRLPGVHDGCQRLTLGGRRACDNRVASSAIPPPKHRIMAFTALNNQPPTPAPVPTQVQAAQRPVVPIPHRQEIDAAFAGDHQLRKRVHAAIGMFGHSALFARRLTLFLRTQSFTEHTLPRHLDVHPEPDFPTAR